MLFGPHHKISFKANLMENILKIHDKMHSSLENIVIRILRTLATSAEAAESMDQCGMEDRTSQYDWTIGHVRKSKFICSKNFSLNRI